MTTEHIKPIIESLLFVSKDPLTLRQIKDAFGDYDTAVIRQAVIELIDEYDRRRGGFYLSEVAGGFQFRTRPEHKDHIKRLIKANPPRLSKAALETLAIIAWNQPMTRSDIEHIRGVDCGGVARALLERKLIKVLGRKEIPGRPLLYATTKQFLEVFDLKDLKDLPTPREIEEMGEAFHDIIVDPEQKADHKPDSETVQEAVEDAGEPETSQDETSVELDESVENEGETLPESLESEPDPEPDEPVEVDGETSPENIESEPDPEPDEPVEVDGETSPENIEPEPDPESDESVENEGGTLPEIPGSKPDFEPDNTEKNSPGTGNENQDAENESAEKKVDGENT